MALCLNLCRKRSGLERRKVFAANQGIRLLREKLSATLMVTLVVALPLSTLSIPAFAADSEVVLHDFHYTDGWAPYAGLVFDAKGNLYGGTSLGGNKSCGQGGGDCGVLFQLAPLGKGKWKETVIHDFNGLDGFGSSTPVFDAAGNMYGSSPAGGTGSCSPNPGCGLIYKFTLGKNGKWTETILHDFGGPDGGVPQGNLIFGPDGTLYGTTLVGGAFGYGTVFHLTPGGKGKWNETVLHSFSATDGAYPYAGLAIDAAGNLYGTTQEGGPHGDGTAFQLSPGAKGKWTETVLHSFSGADGQFPYGWLILDVHGNLYGTTYSGGTYDSGAVFELAHSRNGSWTETVLHSFISNYGENPVAGLISDAAGNLYGTLAYGDNQTCALGCGSVFKLAPGAHGKWTETLLHAFTGSDGGNPYAGLTLDRAGNLYGPTIGGGDSNKCGDSGCGVLFEIPYKLRTTP
jgi:uncharacterized repeat protein (TIGR03803 family)